jgi:hypothetical protein
MFVAVTVLLLQQQHKNNHCCYHAAGLVGKIAMMVGGGQRPIDT